MDNELHFEWAPIKAILNQEKHSVSFEEAKQFSLMRMHFSFQIQIIHPRKRTDSFFLD